MTSNEVLQTLAAHRSVLSEHGVKSLRLFGSVARDEATDQSDVDLLVEFSRPTGLFGLVRLQRYLEELLGREVDLGTTGSLKPRIRDRVLRECIDVP
jgi:predicted nucleotidyltransferase